ncbi:MAG: hypothetical protein GKS00_17475 [Alphaproteobacteria bacterium]|nr:hypothetical protein [Alphaproteobacteria bacterium]
MNLMSMTDNAFQLIGGRTCLDFLNTANWSKDGEVIEDKLLSDKDLALWCHAAGLQDVTGKSGRLTEILEFRGSLRGIFVATLDGTAPTKKGMAALNGALASMPSSALRVSRKKGLALSPSLTLEQAIAISAAAVLSRDLEVSRVKICPGNDCAWLFLDESKNRRRTWCSMETCGNRAKAQRHYQRKTKSAK